jgi:hypothetical protein
MKNLKGLAPFLILAAIGLSALVQTAVAKGNEYDAICDHLEQRYDAKKVKIPFMWLARFAVAVVKPAGVKAFKVTRYRDLRFSPETLNEEMKLTMSNAFGNEWSPILRMRSARSEQAYMNIKESGKNLKIILVTINRDEAIVVRATFNPDKLVAFMENPRMFGISFSDGSLDTPADAEEPTTVEDVVVVGTEDDN